LRKDVYTKSTSVIKVVCFLLGNSPASECQHFGTLCLFHLRRRVGMKNGWD
jgi:hypothetical protein